MKWYNMMVSVSCEMKAQQEKSYSTTFRSEVPIRQEQPLQSIKHEGNRVISSEIISPALLYKEEHPTCSSIIDMDSYEKKGSVAFNEGSDTEFENTKEVLLGNFIENE
jgi:hypothetical protein